MTAHVRYPALDPKDGATVSRAILTDLLRGELGFNGLVVTDSLDMKGITDVEAPDQVVTRAIAAGVDAAMVTTGIDRQLAAATWIDAGVDRARVKDALERMTVFRERFAVEVPDDDIDDAPARRLAAEIAERAVTHHGPPLPRLDPASGSSRSDRHDSHRQETATAGALERACARGSAIASLRARGPHARGDGTVVVVTSMPVPTGSGHTREELLALAGCSARSAALTRFAHAKTPALLRTRRPTSLDALAAVLAASEAPGRTPVRI